MMGVCHLWKTTARDEFLWSRLCYQAWPLEHEFAARLRKISGSFWKTFQLMYSIKEACPEETLVKGGAKKRFVMENLAVFIQVVHCDDIIWAKIETGETLFQNQCLEMKTPLPRFTCGPTEIYHHVEIKLSFVLNDPEERAIYISDRVLSFKDSPLFVSPGGFQLVGSEFSGAEEQFLGVLKVEIDEEETEVMTLTLKGIMSFFLSPKLRDGSQGIEITERYILSLLKRNLYWRKGIKY